MLPAATEELLRKAADDVRAASVDDAVDGVVPSYVVAPQSVDEVAELLRASAGLRVVPRGGGSKLGWGTPPEAVDVLLDLRRLERVLEHNPGDLVVSAEAGIPLATVQQQVGRHGQLLGLDPPEPGATLGGILSTNASGPRRLRYGTSRDLLIGVTVVLADGTVARAGGKVVKNVAGYDLMKLFCGALGTLGVVVETSWRLHPRPPARRVVTLSSYDGGTVQRLLHSTLTPTAAEVMDQRLVVVFESIEPSVDAQAATALQLLGDGEVGEDLPAGFGQRPWSPGEVGLKVTYQIGALQNVLQAVHELGDIRVRGRATVGVLDVGLPALTPGALQQLRREIAAYDGSVVVVEAPPAVKPALDVWGPVGDSLPLMRRVKERFDPDRRFAPGRFVGGI